MRPHALGVAEPAVGLGVQGRPSSHGNAVRLVSDARSLRRLVGCALEKPADFRRVRLAVFRYTRSTAETYRLVRVSDDGTKIHLAFSVSHVCQGIAQQMLSNVALVAIPMTTKPVVADVEHQTAPRCGQLR